MSLFFKTKEMDRTNSKKKTVNYGKISVPQFVTNSVFL